MKRLIAFFTSNWGLKILALVLALVVFYSMKETSRTDVRDRSRPSFHWKGPANGGY